MLSFFSSIETSILSFTLNYVSTSLPHAGWLPLHVLSHPPFAHPNCILRLLPPLVGLRPVLLLSPAHSFRCKTGTIKEVGIVPRTDTCSVSLSLPTGKCRDARLFTCSVSIFGEFLSRKQISAGGRRGRDGYLSFSILHFVPTNCLRTPDPVNYG